MQDDQEPELPRNSPGPGMPCKELAVTAPVLAAKLARLAPEQLATIFPPENSVGPV